MSAGAPAITGHLQRQYPGFRLDARLELPGSGVTALFGASGSGKTTLLRAIAGLDPRTTGALVVRGETWQDTGRNVFLPAWRRPVGFVFQDADLFDHLDVRANLVFGARRARVDDLDRKLDEVVTRLGIESLLRRRPGTLSGGERRRAAIARALLVEPAVLLMDEPLAGLDDRMRHEILPWLERLHRETLLPILYVSHSFDEVVRLADHLVVLAAGAVTASGPLVETLAALEPPLGLGEETGVVLEAVIGELDEPWHLGRVDFAGGHLWLPDQGRAVGDPVRARILARDVSLALAAPVGTSILNVLPGIVDAVVADSHPGLELVRIRVGESCLLARVSRRSAAALALAPGKPVWVQVKAAALVC
jgi:molybdate transport system ATP-binding protein